MISQAISNCVDGRDLSEDQVVQTMEQVTSGGASPAQIAALLISLRMKGETVDEITGAARVLRKRCTQIPVNRDAVKKLIDTCGTGADASGTFNISTVSAFVAAGAGLTVAKHGNKSITSSCGSADLIEALGIPLDLTPKEIGTCIEEVGIGFMFAPLLHGSMKHVAGPRKELGLRTMFNVLGPLSNPARAETQLLGVYDEKLTEIMASVLKRLGCEAAYVVHGTDGLDEISISAPTKVSRLSREHIETFEIAPEDFGIERRDRSELLGGTPEKNREIATSILRGEKGPKRDVVVLNTAAALAAGGLADSIAEGVPLAESSIDSGRALGKLNDLIRTAKNLREMRMGK